MKRVSNRVLVIITVILLALAIIGMVIFLFVFDRNRPRIYQPQIDYRFLQNEIERLASPAKDMSSETIVSQNGFEGIVAFDRSKSSVAEIKAHLAYLSRNPDYGTHITFPNDDYEIFVSAARYTPIARAWGYGWLHYEGNLYAQRNGRDAADEKPNFRNYFSFTLRKADEQFVFTVYCNTSDAEKALSEAINCMNAH